MKTIKTKKRAKTAVVRMWSTKFIMYSVLLELVKQAREDGYKNFKLYLGKSTKPWVSIKGIMPSNYWTDDVVVQDTNMTEFQDGRNKHIDYHKGGYWNSKSNWEEKK